MAIAIAITIVYIYMYSISVFVNVILHRDSLHKEAPCGPAIVFVSHNRALVGNEVNTRKK